MLLCVAKAVCLQHCTLLVDRLNDQEGCVLWPLPRLVPHTTHSFLTQNITTHKQQSVTDVTCVINTVVSVLIFFSSIHASLKLLYSLCFLTYMKMVNSTWFFGPGTTTFAHKVFILTTFVTQSFDLKMTYFRHRHSRRKLALFRCKLLNKTLY